MDTTDTVGAYLSDMSRYGRLTAAEEKTAIPASLVESNLRLVISVAKRYQHYGLGLSDLIQEGNIGLIKASKSYDSNRAKFSTWADEVIRNQIIDALKAQKPVVDMVVQDEPSSEDRVFEGVSDSVDAILKTLDSNEYRVSMLIAAGFNLLTQSDRQFNDSAMRKLAHPSRLRLLKRTQ